MGRTDTSFKEWKEMFILTLKQKYPGKMWTLWHFLVATPLCEIGFYMCPECAMKEGMEAGQNGYQ